MQVVGANKGGVVAEVEGLRGFVPFSQISSVSSWTKFAYSNTKNLCIFLLIMCSSLLSVSIVRHINLTYIQ